MGIILFFLALGIVIAAIVLIMLSCGWRLDVEEEKEAWKRAPVKIKALLTVAPCALCGLAMWAMGMNKKTAMLVTICLMFFAGGAGWFWSYKKMKNELKKLNNELTCKRKDKPPNKLGG